MAFCLSTQRKSWIITEDDIEQLRYLANHQIVISPKKVQTLPSEVSVPAILSLEEKSLIQEEDVYLIRYCRFIQVYFGETTDEERRNGKKRASGVALYWRVSATAIVFFRRFYLNNSFLAFDPRIMMLASVFLAGKIEENPVRVKDLLAINKDCTADLLFAHELFLLEGLNYCLRVFHPRSTAHTIIADFKRCQENKNLYHQLAPDNSVLENKDLWTNEIFISNTSINIQENTEETEKDNIQYEQQIKRVKVESTTTTDEKMLHAEVDIPEDRVDGNRRDNKISKEVNREGSKLRQIWRLEAENILNKIQYSVAIFVYTPTEISVAALDIAAYAINTKYPDLHSQYHTYLISRFGEKLSNKFNEQRNDIIRYVEYVKTVENDDKTFKKVKERLKKDNVWNTKQY